MIGNHHVVGVCTLMYINKHGIRYWKCADSGKLIIRKSISRSLNTDWLQGQKCFGQKLERIKRNWNGALQGIGKCIEIQIFVRRVLTLASVGCTHRYIRIRTTSEVKFLSAIYAVGWLLITLIPTRWSPSKLHLRNGGSCRHHFDACYPRLNIETMWFNSPLLDMIAPKSQCDHKSEVRKLSHLHVTKHLHASRGW